MSWPKEVELASDALRTFGATRLLLFGSYAEGREIENSDIDLIVDGIRDEDLLPAMAYASKLSERFVDLVSLTHLVSSHFSGLLDRAVEL